MLFYIPLALIAVVYSLYWYFTRTFNYWKDKNVAHSKPLPLVGNLKESFLRQKPIAIVTQELYNSFPDEKVIGIYRMTTPCLLIRDLDIIKQVMIKDFDIFIDRGIEFCKEGLGANLFHSDGDTWQVLRNRFTPLFTSGKLKNMFYLLNERGDKFVDYVDDICRKQPEQEIHSLVQEFTMATIAACAFGLDIDRLNKESLKKIDKLIFTANRSNDLDMMYPGILKQIGGSLFPKEINEFFNNLTKTVISERNGMPANRKDYMDLILELRQEGVLHGVTRQDKSKLTLELTESVIAAQSFVFYAGGYETTATTLAYLLYQLALNPEIQDKLVQEIDAVLQRHDGQITYDNLKEMNYMTKVFDETLRLYPNVDPLERKAKFEYKIPGTNVVVEKDQKIFVSIHGIHHDEKYYPNPKKFDPERFAPENVKDRHPCAYMPFGVGPRHCIGMRFAKVQAQVGLMKLLSKFRVEPSRNTKMKLEFDPYRVVLGAREGIHLNVVPRDK